MVTWSIKKADKYYYNVLTVEILAKKVGIFKACFLKNVIVCDNKFYICVRSYTNWLPNEKLAGYYEVLFFLQL